MKKLVKTWLKLVAVGGLISIPIFFLSERKSLSRDRESLVTYVVFTPLLFLLGCVITVALPLLLFEALQEKIRGNQSEPERVEENDPTEWTRSLRIGDPIAFLGGTGPYRLQAEATVREITPGLVRVRIEKLVFQSERSKFRRGNTLWATRDELHPAPPY